MELKFKVVNIFEFFKLEFLIILDVNYFLQLFFNLLDLFIDIGKFWTICLSDLFKFVLYMVINLRLMSTEINFLSFFLPKHLLNFL